MTPEAFDVARARIRGRVFRLAHLATVRAGAETHRAEWDGAPETLDECASRIIRERAIVVDANNSARTVWGYHHYNWAFRAWHDACHILVGEDFQTFEPLTFAQQRADLIADWGSSDEVEILRAETIGQGQHFLEHGRFPSDQYAFTRAYCLGQWQREAM